MLRKLYIFSKCYYLSFQNAYLNRPLKKKVKNTKTLQAKALKSDKSLSPPPSPKQRSGCALSRQSAGSLERELWAKAPWHEEVLQLMCIRHRSKASALMSCASGPAGWGASSKRFGPGPRHLGFLQLLRPRLYQENFSWVWPQVFHGKFKVYSSLGPFIHGAATEKQLQLVPPRRVSPPESLVRGQTGKFP